MLFKNKIRNLLKEIIWKVSPTFRLLTGNKQRVKLLSEKIKSLDELLGNNNELLKSNYEIQKDILLKIENLEKASNLSFYALRKEICKIDTIVENNINIKNKFNNEKFVSIICLIYRSTCFAKAVYDSLHKFTPKLNSGEAELIFVANDATEDVIRFLKKERYNFVINNNKVLSEDELFNSGYGAPEYINRVYRGYNFGIKNCKGNIVVLINSDNMFSPNWLENLLDKLDENSIICSQLVEREHPKFGKFPSAILGDFGNHPNNFREDEFIHFANKASENKLISGGAYMPCISYKENFRKVGYYPEGNIVGKSFNEIIQYGDENLYEKLSRIGVVHMTACDSIVYHFKEGERED